MLIRLAGAPDVTSLMTLEQANFVDNLDVSQRQEGYISILHPQSWFEAAVTAGGVHVAVDEADEIVGFIVVTDPPNDPAQVKSPILRAMVELASEVAFAGRPVAAQRYGFRGPVLIARSARGKGLYGSFNETIREAYRDQYDLLALFVASDNRRSLHTTTTKLGASCLATFVVDDRQYHFMVYRLS